MDCIFCRIISGEMPADVIFRDEVSVAFRDIHPQAPKHILIIPRTHLISMSDASDQYKDLIGHLLKVGKLIAEKEGVSTKGFRLVINCGPDGGQIIPHLHIHLLGGRRLADLMG